MSVEAVAALAAALGGAALLIWLIADARARARLPALLEHGEGPPILLIADNPGRAQALFKIACAHIAERRLIAPVRADPARCVEGRPIVIAHGRGCRVALALAARGRVAALVLIAPRAKPPAAADILFPPAVLLADSRARLRALCDALPTFERIAAKGLGRFPHRRRPDLLLAALDRAETLAAEAS